MAVVDTQGLLFKYYMTSVSLSEREGFFGLLDQWKNPRRKMKRIWIDRAYTGEDVKDYAWRYKILTHVVKKTSKEFKVLHKRWVVECTFA